MREIFCPRCRLQQPLEHLYCARCGAPLPQELLDPRAKSVRLFAGVKVDSRDPDGAFLRVSRYRADQVFETPDGTVTVPGHHVRFSVWVDNRALCVLSLPESEARELADFLAEELGRRRGAAALT